MIPEARVFVEGVDISCDVVLGVTISHGRQSVTEQPEAATANLDLIAVERATVDRLVINAFMQIEAVFPGEVFVRRFTGRITDVQVAWETVDYASVNVIAASVVARLGRVFIGDTVWPVEDDGDRAGRILTAASAATGIIDPGTLNVLGRDVDRQPCLTLLQELADDAGGLAWHTRSGHMCYADAEHRRNTPSSLTLDACNILMSPTWRRSTEGLANEVRVSYGAVPEGGEQATVLASNPDSIATYGLLAVSVSTKLADMVDAQQRADVMIARSSEPEWNISELPIELGTVDEPTASALLNLEIHDLITVTGLPDQGPAVSESLWVEGWAERISSFGATGTGSWELTLSVSAYCRTAAYLRWLDVPPEPSWDSLGDITWNDATCIGPTPDQGRWDDIAANQRWSTLPAGVSWDEWGSNG